MKLTLGSYEIRFENSGVEVYKNNLLCYFNHRPVYVSVKTYGATSEFRDVAYDSLECEGEAILGSARFTTDFGSELTVRDRYEIVDGLLKIARKTVVEKAVEDDLGFQTKIFFYQAASDNLEDYWYFSPGQWYQDNRYAGAHALGKSMDLQYYYRKETYSGLPLFAIAAKQRNPKIDAWMKRQYCDIEVVERGSAKTLVEIKAKLESGRAFAILPDLRVKDPDVEVDFLGGKANVSHAGAMFAVKGCIL